MSARLVLSKRSNIFPLSISLKTKVFWNQFRLPRALKYHIILWKSAQRWSNSRFALGGLGHFLVIVTNGVNMSPRLLLSKRSKIFSLSISIKTKVITNQFTVPKAKKYRPSSWKSASSCSTSRFEQGGLAYFLVIVTNGVNMWARLLLSKRSKIFPLCISLKTKVFSNQVRVLTALKYRPNCWKSA